MVATKSHRSKPDEYFVYARVSAKSHHPDLQDLAFQLWKGWSLATDDAQTLKTQLQQQAYIANRLKIALGCLPEEWVQRIQATADALKIAEQVSAEAHRLTRRMKVASDIWDRVDAETQEMLRRAIEVEL